MKQFLLRDELETLTGIQERLFTTRPDGLSAEALIHDAVYDGLSAVITTGQGIMSTANDFRNAGASVKKAVMAS